uniref:Uncharacterized protein n=1 Tax=Psilocybe cubensis TaxID=181762 RepID=A0A8H8CI02_PSICU
MPNIEPLSFVLPPTLPPAPTPPIHAQSVTLNGVVYNLPLDLAQRIAKLPAIPVSPQQRRYQIVPQSIPAQPQLPIVPSLSQHCRHQIEPPPLLQQHPQALAFQPNIISVLPISPLNPNAPML